MTDEAAMSAVASGDLAQAALLYERYKRPLFNFFLHRAADRETAQELVQRTFERLLTYRRGYRVGERFRPYVYQIARNVLRDFQTSAARQTHQVPDQPDESATLAEGEEAARLVTLALSYLPDDAREVLVLSRYDNLSYEEISRVLDCSVGAVKVRVHRALNRLRAVYFQLNER